MFIPEREKPQNWMIDILNADSKNFHRYGGWSITKKSNVVF